MYAPESFRMLSRRGELGIPLVGRDFVPWYPPYCIKRDLFRILSVGSRLGLAANGFFSGWLQSLSPALRRASLREALAMPECQGRAGHIPAKDTDSSLGFSAMAYRSADVTFTRCDAAG